MTGGITIGTEALGLRLELGGGTCTAVDEQHRQHIGFQLNAIKLCQGIIKMLPGMQAAAQAALTVGGVLGEQALLIERGENALHEGLEPLGISQVQFGVRIGCRSEEHTSELQSRPHLVCRLLLEKKKQI